VARQTFSSAPASSAGAGGKAGGKCRIIVSESNNPFFNIAYEQYLFSSPETKDERVLFLWRNEASVIIGRFQGAWKECKVNTL
jgi:lipoate-protein ligase A